MMKSLVILLCHVVAVCLTIPQFGEFPSFPSFTNLLSGRVPGLDIRMALPEAGDKNSKVDKKTSKKKLKGILTYFKV